MSESREPKIQTRQFRTEADKITEEEQKELIDKFKQKYTMFG